MLQTWDSYAHGFDNLFILSAVYHGSCMPCWNLNVGKMEIVIAIILYYLLILDGWYVLYQLTMLMYIGDNASVELR